MPAGPRDGERACCCAYRSSRAAGACAVPCGGEPAAPDGVGGGGRGGARVQPCAVARQDPQGQDGPSQAPQAAHAPLDGRGCGWKRRGGSEAAEGVWGGAACDQGLAVDAGAGDDGGDQAAQGPDAGPAQCSVLLGEGPNHPALPGQRQPDGAAACTDQGAEGEGGEESEGEDGQAAGRAAQEGDDADPEQAKKLRRTKRERVGARACTWCIWAARVLVSEALKSLGPLHGVGGEKRLYWKLVVGSLQWA
mmetsp:Transcript_44144/g.88536  ORF Transcript_44144/g.88536 Transcript_44144/m.88536 type:complete len:250 (-) Transcript_44144:20-769(-)